MATDPATFRTYDVIGRREDLIDIIYNISPMDTPCLSGFGRGKSKQISHEWQTDALAAVDLTNAQIDGDDSPGDTLVPTARINNHNQISRKVVVVSGTSDAVDKAGRRKETAYQVAKVAKELKRDMEAILCQNQASLVGDSSTARKLGSVEAWLETNTDRGATGTDGGFSGGIVAAAGDGTQRALTEVLVKNVIQLCWTEGGEPNVILVGPKNKQNFSAFIGSADHRREEMSADKTLTNAIDVYRSDFGDLRIVPSRFSRDRSAIVLDMSLWKVCYLRPFQQSPLAKTGDSTKRLMIVEYTLRASQEKGSGIVADLTV